MSWALDQHDLPGRPGVPAEILHRRRERLFLLLASLVVAAAVMLPLLGIGRLFGVSSLVRRIGIEPPATLLLPIGTLALPIGLLALALVSDLYSRTRARALLLVVMIAWLGVLGLQWATDHVPAYDTSTTTAFWPGLALAACGFVICAIQIELFALLGRLRYVLAPLVGIAAGWALFALIMQRGDLPGTPDDAVGIALAAGGYTWLAVVLGTLPVVLVMRALAVYLRVEVRQVADDPGASDPAFLSRATPMPSKRAFTSDEVAFFDAGDALASRKSAADSFSDLERRK